MTQLWCNDQWLDFEDFPISPTDRGAILGLGLFETLLALDGVPVFAARHLARLKRGCEQLGWQLTLPDFQETARELLTRNHLASGRARVRLAISGGTGSINDLTSGSDAVVSMVALRVGEIPGSLTLNFSPWPRNERSPLAGLKCASYAENVIALDRARRLGFDETVFFNSSGQLCEAATANIFLVKDGSILTPSLESGCLPGITREVVIELAEKRGIPCQERVLTATDLQAADELFVTASIRGLMGVSRLEERIFPVGAITSILRESWNEVALQSTQFGDAFF
jgi:branched-subunit amino acid aminotransferase/4-amino-4-deoxychorismate lyase